MLWTSKYYYVHSEINHKCFSKKENIWLKSSFFFLFSKFYGILNQMIFFQTNKLKVKINLGNSLEHFNFFQKFLYMWVNSFICLKTSLEFLYLAKLSNSLKQKQDFSWVNSVPEQLLVIMRTELQDSLTHNVLKAAYWSKGHNILCSSLTSSPQLYRANHLMKI